MRHELIMLPYYGVFDPFASHLDEHRVTLLGYVTRPALKADAGRAGKDIEGVEAVDNQIEVLPPSPSRSSGTNRPAASAMSQTEISATSPSARTRSSQSACLTRCFRPREPGVSSRQSSGSC